MAGPLRLLAVAGYNGRKNDIIYNKCKTGVKAATKVVFFGGDVQVISVRVTSTLSN